MIGADSLGWIEVPAGPEPGFHLIARKDDPVALGAEGAVILAACYVAARRGFVFIRDLRL